MPTPELAARPPTTPATAHVILDSHRLFHTATARTLGDRIVPYCAASPARGDRPHLRAHASGAYARTAREVLNGGDAVCDQTRSDVQLFVFVSVLVALA